MSEPPQETAKSIGEAAEALDLPQHVLRFWEKKFDSLRPQKSADNHRLYDRDMMALLLRIKRLLYEEGYSIKGAQKILNGASAAGTTDGTTETATENTSPPAPSQSTIDAERLRQSLRYALAALRDARAKLSKERRG